MVGFVLPFWIVVGSFAAAFLVNILVNPVLYAYDVLHTWEPGMSAIPTQIANSFDFWLSFSIGGAVLVAVMGFAMVGKTLWTLRGVKREGGRRRATRRAAVTFPSPSPWASGR